MIRCEYISGGIFSEKAFCLINDLLDSLINMIHSIDVLSARSSSD